MINDPVNASTGDPAFDLVAAVYRTAVKEALGQPGKVQREAVAWLDVTASDWREFLSSEQLAKLRKNDMTPEQQAEYNAYEQQQREAEQTPQRPQYTDYQLKMAQRFNLNPAYVPAEEPAPVEYPKRRPLTQDEIDQLQGRFKPRPLTADERAQEIAAKYGVNPKYVPREMFAEEDAEAWADVLAAKLEARRAAIQKKVPWLPVDSIPADWYNDDSPMWRPSVSEQMAADAERRAAADNDVGSAQ